MVISFFNIEWSKTTLYYAKIFSKKGAFWKQKEVLSEENLVKKTCRELGITQKELAEKIGLTDRTLSKYATNTHIPKNIVNHIKLLADTIRITIRATKPMRTADFNRKLQSYGIIERFGNGSKVSNSSSWILLDIGENRHFKEGTNHRYYKSTFRELLDLVSK